MKSTDTSKYDFKKYVTDKKMKLDYNFEKELHDIKLHMSQNLDLESKNLFNFARSKAIPGTLKESVKKGFFSSSTKKQEEKPLIEEMTYDRDDKYNYQNEFDQAYSISENKQKMLKNKFALSSREAMKDEFIYFDHFDGKLSDAIYQYQSYMGQVPQSILIKYASKIGGMKNHRHLLHQLINEELLKAQPELAKTMRNYINKECQEMHLLY